MKPELENLKEYPSKISLTSGEKFDMLQNLRAYSNAHPVRSRYSIFMKYSLAYASAFALIVGTGATSFAAEASLPGDILYPVKTNINEKVFETINFSKASKAQVAVGFMDKRMKELEKMIITQKDTPEKIDIIVEKLEENKKDLEEYTEQVEPTDHEEVQRTADLYTELETIIDTHIDILEDIAKDEKVEVAPEKSENAIEDTQENDSDEPSNKENVSITIVIDTSSSSVNEPKSMKVVSKKMPKNTEKTDTTEASSTQGTSEITSEEYAVSEIVSFSTKLDTIITSAKEKANQEDETSSQKIKSDTRKKIIEDVEKELQIEVEEEGSIKNSIL